MKALKIFLIIAGIGTAMVAGYFADSIIGFFKEVFAKPPQLTVTFVIVEPPSLADADAIVNGVKYSFSEGKVITIYKNEKGVQLSYQFVAPGYESLSNGGKDIEAGVLNDVITVRFKKIAAKFLPVQEAPGEKKLNLTITTKPVLKGVDVYYGNRQIGTTNDAGIVKFQKMFQVNEATDSSFTFSHTDYQMEPPTFAVNVTQTITKTLILTPHVKNDFTVEYQFINTANKAPLANVDVISLDGKLSGKTDGNGKIVWTLTQPKWQQVVGFKVETGNVLPLSSPTITIDGSKTSDNQTIECKVSYGMVVMVNDNFSNPVKDANISIGGKVVGKTDQGGKAIVPVDIFNASVKLKISKQWYITVETNVTPIENNAQFDFVLNSSSAIIIVVDSVSQKPVEFVDIVKNTKTIGQTDENGKVTIPVVLAEKMTLTLKPVGDLWYKTRIQPLIFMENNEQKWINLIPLPYQFILNIMNEGNSPIMDAQINYKNRMYHSDMKGKIVIDDYTPQFPVKLEIKFRLATSKLLISKEEGKRVYERSQVIPSHLPVSFASVGNTDEENAAKIKVLNHSGALMKEATAPFDVKLEAGSYTVIAEADGRKVKKIIDIHEANQKIEINMADPLQVIKNFYQQKQYKQAIDVYEKMYSDIMDKENWLLKRKDDFCKLNDILGKCYSLQGQYNKASDFTKRQIKNNCKTDDPVFYYNMGDNFYNLGKWEDAVIYYEIAYINRQHFSNSPAGNRAQKSADCRYFQASAAFQIYEENQQKNYGTPLSRCHMLDDAERYLEEFDLLAKQNLLQKKNAQNIQDKIYTAKVNEGCKP